MKYLTGTNVTEPDKDVISLYASCYMSPVFVWNIDEGHMHESLWRISVKLEGFLGRVHSVVML